MFRTALVGTAIVAGCLIGGCNSKESNTPSSSNQPPSVQEPANQAAKTAKNAANDTANNNNPGAEATKLFQQVSDEAKDGKIDAAADDLKKLEDMKDKLTAQQQSDLPALENQVKQAQAAEHARPGSPATMPAMPH